MSVKTVLIPTLRSIFIGRRRISEWKVDLRIDIIHPAFLPPFVHIGIQAGITAEAIGFRTSIIFFFISPDGKRTDSEFYPRFFGMDRFIEFFDQKIHIVAAPRSEEHTSELQSRGHL